MIEIPRIKNWYRVQSKEKGDTEYYWKTENYDDLAIRIKDRGNVYGVYIDSSDYRVTPDQTSSKLLRIGHNREELKTGVVEWMKENPNAYPDDYRSLKSHLRKKRWDR